MMKNFTTLILTASVACITALSSSAFAGLVCKGEDTNGARELILDNSALPLTNGKVFHGILNHTAYGQKATYQIDCMISVNDDGSFQCGQKADGLNLGLKFNEIGEQLKTISLLEEFHGGYGTDPQDIQLTCE